MKRYSNNLVESRGLWYNERIDMLADICGDLLDGKIILDIGSSEARLKDNIRSNKYYALDLNDEALEKARKRGCSIVRQNLNEKSRLSFKDNSFDAIICTEMLEHLFLPDSTMLEIIRISKRNSVLFVSVPNEVFWINRIAVLFGKSFDWDGLYTFGGHVHFPTIKQSDQFIKSFPVRIQKKDYWYNYKYRQTPFWNIIPRKLKRKITYLMPSMFARGVVYTLINKKRTEE